MAKEILPIARKIVEDEKIDIVHHITFNEFRTPGKLYQLPVPFVWGPIEAGSFIILFSKTLILVEKISTKKIKEFYQ